jgi:DNA-binding transcriptional ArsR family regulator
MAKTSKTPKKDDLCEITYVHKDKVDSARKALHDTDTTRRLSGTFKVLSDPTRLNIVVALTKEELCVCDIAALLSTTESAISHQLRMLKDLRLVKYTRRGKMTYYSLDDEHIDDLIRVAFRHVSEL